MLWKKEDKQLAQRLRSKGLTYSEIKDKIDKNIPKSTLSNWCSNVKLPNFYQEKLDKLNLKSRDRGRKIALLVNKRKREKFLLGLERKNYHLLKSIDKDILKLLLAVFYLAEGSKHPSTQCLKFGSSDPETIRFFLRSLRKVFIVDDTKFRVEILCRADQDLDELKGFWHKVTKINKKLFYKPRTDKRTIGKKTRKRGYKGVCVIDYFDTAIQLELQLLGRLIVDKI